MPLYTGLKLLYNFIFRTKYRRLTVNALFLSAIARMRIVFMPGPKLHKYMGIRGEETPSGELPVETRVKAARVAQKVARVARRTPWESRCLVQAMVAQRMLRSYGLSSTLYLGVGRRPDNSEIIAHAWVRCGSDFICGMSGIKYATVAYFAMHPKGRD